MPNRWEVIRDRALRRFGRPLGEGIHRIVFRDGGEVIKIPTRDSGINANFHEMMDRDPDHARSRKDRALTRLFGVLVIRMEYVEPVRLEARRLLPSWCNFVDCQQVGVSSDGRLLAYDWEHEHR